MLLSPEKMFITETIYSFFFFQFKFKLVNISVVLVSEVEFSDLVLT